MRASDAVVLVTALLVVLGGVFLLALVLGTLSTSWTYDPVALACVSAQRAAERARAGVYRTRAACLAHAWRYTKEGVCTQGAGAEDLAYLNEDACLHPPDDVAGAFYQLLGQPGDGVGTCRETPTPGVPVARTYQDLDACRKGRYIRSAEGTSGAEGCKEADQSTPQDAPLYASNRCA